MVDTGASALVVGKHLVHMLGIWKRARKVEVMKGDGSCIGGYLVVNTSIKVMDSASVLDKFAMDAEVMDIENRDVILGLSWLMENGFSVYTQDRCLRNVNSDKITSCSIRWIPEA